MTDLPQLSRAPERRDQSAERAHAWEAGQARVALFRSGQVLVVETSSSLAWLRSDEVGASVETALYLGSQEGIDHYALTVSGGTPPSSGAWRELRSIGADLAPHEQEAVLIGSALAQWHERAGHCPRCGSELAMGSGGWQLHCEQHGAIFPRMDPAMIVLVTDEHDRALLGRRPQWEPGWFSTLAGFVEAGETVEACLLREVREEAGIEVDPASVTYFSSQPWPFPASLMLGFHAAVAGPVGELVLQADELAEARWFSREQLADECGAGLVRLPPRFSIARRLVEHWYGAELPGDWSR